MQAPFWKKSIVSTYYSQKENYIIQVYINVQSDKSQYSVFSFLLATEYLKQWPIEVYLATSFKHMIKIWKHFG